MYRLIIREIVYVDFDRKILRKWSDTQWRKNSLLVERIKNSFMKAASLKLGIDKWGRFVTCKIIIVEDILKRGTSMR